MAHRVDAWDAPYVPEPALGERGSQDHSSDDYAERPPYARPQPQGAAAYGVF